MHQIWDKLPEGLNILVTHGPPFGILDATPHFDGYERCGCRALAKRVKEIKPRYHAFGHIHDSHGVAREDETTFINAAIMNDSYKVTFEPIVLEINPKDQEGNQPQGETT
jgi:Icc-related predicted phosphoesterase